VLTVLQKLRNAVIMGDTTAVAQLTQQVLDEGLAASTVFEQGLIPAMDTVGQQMKANEIYIPEVLRAAQAMRAGLVILEPRLTAMDGRWQARGRVVIGTVSGDLHDIGKNMVIMMLKGAGFETIDLGINVPRERFVASILEEKPDILGLSALLTTTMMEMENVIEALEKVGCRDSVKVLVGGAPLSQAFADQIDADGYGPDASTGVDIARSWMAEKAPVVSEPGSGENE